MESWDVYDRNRMSTGRKMIRGDKFEAGSYHLVVHVCIFNSKCEMLIQLRHPQKDAWPGLWDMTVGGSAISGDSSQMAAEREAFEELGCKLDLSNIRPHLCINFEQGFDDYYLLNIDIDIEKLTLQQEEVSEVKWASREEILSLIAKGEFIPYHESLIDLLFSMRKRYGALNE
ncbi:MAG: NUDIX domain-containing protein [Clostridiales bacterium]|nr:NUDIX domain-containing protein [Clostridiales bacterium]